MEKNDYLIEKKVYRYMLTGVLTTVAFQLGNVVDAMIVGNLLGSMGNGAVSASTPLNYLLQAAAILMGSGGAVAIAILLGRRNITDSGKVMSFCMLTSIIYPLIFTVLSPILIPAFVSFTGATGEFAVMIRDYTRMYIYGMPVISFVVVMAYLINADNHPALSARLYITANLINLISDYILVKYTALGISGAALSTALGYFVAGIIIIPMYFSSKNRMVSPIIKELFSDISIYKITIQRGMPNLANLVMTVIGVSIINISVIGRLGSGYFSAYAVANNTQLIVQMFLNGISSVIASVAGVLYGEKDYLGMRSVLARVLRTALLTGGIITLIFLAAPQLIASLYGFGDENVRNELYGGLRVFALSFCFFTLNALSQNYYRTTGHAFLSIASLFMQLLLFKVPLMLVFMNTYGFIGIFMGIVLSEFCSFVVLNLIRLLLQMAGRVPKKGFMAIPDNNPGELLRLTIKGSDNEAVRISEKIIKTCEENGMSHSKANALGIAAEEITANIGRHGYRNEKDKYIDVCLSKLDDGFLLRFRDDGIPFDPVSYVPNEHDDYEIHGLLLIKKLAVKMTYVRAISLNNTVIEL